jgi:hypothetical protein
VGTEFDTPINSLSSPDFTHFFHFAGTYPFFCRPPASATCESPCRDTTTAVRSS